MSVDIFFRWTGVRNVNNGRYGFACKTMNYEVPFDNEGTGIPFIYIYIYVIIIVFLIFWACRGVGEHRQAHGQSANCCVAELLRVYFVCLVIPRHMVYSKPDARVFFAS